MILSKGQEASQTCHDPLASFVSHFVDGSYFAKLSRKHIYLDLSVEVEIFKAVPTFHQHTIELQNMFSFAT
jgi:hypothetical protein